MKEQSELRHRAFMSEIHKANEKTQAKAMLIVGVVAVVCIVGVVIMVGTLILRFGLWP